LLKIHKIDYGETYERNRVLQKYPRIKGKKLEAMQKAVDDRDDDVLAEFFRCDAFGIDECLRFVEELFKPAWKTTITKLKRTLVVVLTLSNRAEDLKRDGDEDAIEYLRDRKVLGRLKNVVSVICVEMGGVEQTKEAISSTPLLKNVFVKSVESLSAVDVESRDFALLLATLWTNPVAKRSK
jgi:hypothetical protein